MISPKNLNAGKAVIYFHQALETFVSLERESKSFAQTSSIQIGQRLSSVGALASVRNYARRRLALHEMPDKQHLGKTMEKLNVHEGAEPEHSKVIDLERDLLALIFTSIFLTGLAELLLKYGSKLITHLLYFDMYAVSSNRLYFMRWNRSPVQMYLMGGIVANLLLAIIALVIIIPKIRSTQRRKALEEILARYEHTRLALVRYVQLKRQCSEEVAYQHIVTFVKKHMPLNEHSSIDRMLAFDRQNLLDLALSILVQHPDEIDKI